MNIDRLAVFGGSFDPPHIGHVHVAEAAAELFCLDEVIWIPAHRSPFKTDSKMSADSDRLAMIERAIVDYPLFSVSDIELQRGGVSYTIDTLRAIQTDLPDAQLFLLIGEDAYVEFDRWHLPDEIRNMARLIVYPRAHERPRRFISVEPDECIEGVHMDVSSSDIRKKIKRGESIDGLVPDTVRVYIESNDLYSAA